jgi:ATP-dependent RNA helicase RhlE
VIKEQPYHMGNPSIVVSTSGVMKDKDVNKKIHEKKAHQNSYFRKDKKKS